MRRISVGLGSRSYEIVIASGALAYADQLTERFFPHGRAIVVSDRTVAEHWLESLGQALGRSGIEADPVILPPGEATKSWRTLECLTDALIKRGIAHDEHLIALGGGVVGDIAGFAASIVKRGCGWIQIPTSLLAQVDSSVGGKTAINTGAGKNLIGAFHQPGLVIIDPDILATLPDRDLRAGYAEIVKYGLVGDQTFFDWCEANRERLLDRDSDALTEAITRAITMKAKVVAADETDRTGRRALLNLGHTFAHALEAETGLENELLHGEAVAIGMALAFAFSARCGICDEEVAARVVRHLSDAGLPTALPAGVDPRRLVGRMRSDKKSVSGSPTLILARGIGQAFVAPDIDPAALEAFLEDQLSLIGRE